MAKKKYYDEDSEEYIWDENSDYDSNDQFDEEDLYYDNSSDFDIN